MEYIPATERVLVQEFSWIPDEVANGMVRPQYDEGIKIPFVNTCASMGNFDRIPTELVHMIFEDLTMEDLAALRRTCRRSRALVPGCLTYKDLVAYVPSLLRVLEDMELLGTFTLRHMMATISSHTCVGCGNFGACVFLPEFTRCCYTCLQYNEAFWVMPQVEARRCFNLPDTIDDTIPFYWSIPGRYEMMNEPPVYSSGSKKMVSVRAAKALAMELWGAEELKNHLSWLCMFQVFDFETLGRYSQLHFTPLKVGPQHHPPEREPGYFHDLNGWPGMGAMLVPIIIKQRHADTIVETGVWCRGCAEAASRWRHLIREQKLLVKQQAISEQRVYPTKHKVAKMMKGMEWASELFLNHAHSCYGLSLWKHEHYSPDLPYTADFEGQLNELLDEVPNTDMDSGSDTTLSDISMASD